ncbi:MAG: PTS fructose transporter subunit IIA [Verrucomicrobiota bacterium]
MVSGSGKSLSGGPMVGLVVVTHGCAADCLLQAVAGILGQLPAAVPVSISMEETFDETLERVGRACDEVDTGAGVVILVDLQGSSPYQACMAMLDGSRPAEVVCGVNLAMMLKLATIDRREPRPPELAQLLRDVGKRSIRLGSELTGRVALDEIGR